MTEAQLTTDQNHLLTIQDSSLDTGKTYRHTLSWLQIDEPNCIFPALHKKEVKLIQSKNLGETMGVFAIFERKAFQSIQLSTDFFRLATEHFIAFDEETGERYAFLPYFPTKEVNTLNDKLKKLDIQISFSTTTKGVITKWLLLPDLPADASLEQDLSHLYALTLLYWKFEAKWESLNSMKIQIPIFWSYLSLQSIFEAIISRLQKQWIYLSASLNTQNGKSTFQISSSDRELLQIFAKWHSNIQHYSSITKRSQTDEAIDKLKNFLSSNHVENWWEIKQTLSTWTIKLLVK